MKVKANQVEPEGVMDKRLDIESNDLLDEGRPIRFDTVPPGVGVNMTFFLPVVFGVCSKEDVSK